MWQGAHGPHAGSAAGGMWPLQRGGCGPYSRGGCGPCRGGGKTQCRRGAAPAENDARLARLTARARKHRRSATADELPTFVAAAPPTKAQEQEANALLDDRAMRRAYALAYGEEAAGHARAALQERAEDRQVVLGRGRVQGLVVFFWCFLVFFIEFFLFEFEFRKFKKYIDLVIAQKTYAKRYTCRKFTS